MEPLEWGRLVMTLRTLRGWSREELATASEVHRATIERQEEGVSQPTVDARKRIEVALGIDEGSTEVATYLAELRETLLQPGRRRGPGSATWAGVQASRQVQAALWLALEEFRETREGEPGLPWKDLVATLRTLLGWSQRDLSAKAGVHSITLSKLETGAVRTRQGVLEKVERALGLEGIAEEVRTELGGLRARMLAPSRPVVTTLIAQAGAETALFVEQSYRLVLEDLRKLG